MAIYKDSSKRYSIKFYLTLPNGEVRDVRIRNKDWTTKKRCQLVYDDVVAEKKKEILASYNITATSNFDNFANDFIKRFSLTRKKGTISQVELIIKNHIKPYINGKDSVADIFTSTYLISLENKIRDNLIKNNYSMRQYNRAVHVLGLMSEYALQLKLINSDNYSESKSVLVKAKEDKVVNEKLEWYTNEQMEQFFSVFDKGEYKRKVFFEVAYYGGLRIGEILGLTWNDFDSVKKTISVNKQLDTQSKVATTKTRNSNDNVDLPTKVCDDLVAMKNAYNPKGTDYIFFIQNTSRTTVRRKFTYFQNKAGLPHIKFHGLRHSIASRMINQGINPLFVSKHLRHSNPSITLSTYSHMFGKITAGLMDNL